MRHWTYRKDTKIADVNQWIKEELDVLVWKDAYYKYEFHPNDVPRIVWNWRLEDLENDYDVTKSSYRKI
jgi:hypothetical protein